MREIKIKQSRKVRELYELGNTSILDSLRVPGAVVGLAGKNFAERPDSRSIKFH